MCTQRLLFLLRLGPTSPSPSSLLSGESGCVSGVQQADGGGKRSCTCRCATVPRRSPPSLPTRPTPRRGKLRREMNATDQVKSARATDALLNYETVKYFTNER